MARASGLCVPGSDKVAWLLNPPLWCGLYLSLYHSANLLPAIFCAYFFALFDQINRAVQSNTDALVDACMGIGKKMNYLQYSARRRVVSVVLSFARFFSFCLFLFQPPELLPPGFFNLFAHSTQILLLWICCDIDFVKK